MSGLRERIQGVLDVSPSSPMLEYAGHWKSWRDVSEGMKRLDALLAAAGLGEEARIGVVLRNRPEAVAAILELLASHRTIVTLNPVYPDERLASYVKNVRAPAIVAASADWARPGFEAAVRATGALGIEATSGSQGAPDFALRFPGQPALWSKRDAAGVAVEMLTSGTTGAPKRIPLPRRNFERSMSDWGRFEKGRDDAALRLRSGIQIAHTSFAHIGGLGGMVNIVLAGRKFCLLERFTVPAFHDAVLRHRPKVLNGPPAVLRMLLDAGLPREDFSSVAVFRLGTAPLDPALAEAFYERYGIPVLQNYGATEFAGGVAGWTLEDFKAHPKDKIGSVGRLNPGIEGRIVDPETREPLAPGATGLLELRAAHLGDGKDWLRTTDLAAIDADGFLFLRGRADNAINRGGYKIAPDDVVRALEAHPAILEAAVVGTPDQRLGEVPVAAYSVKSGAGAPTSAELSEFLRKSLLPYQVPVAFVAVAELPHTASMKIDQLAVRKLLENAGAFAARAASG